MLPGHRELTMATRPSPRTATFATTAMRPSSDSPRISTSRVTSSKLTATARAPPGCSVILASRATVSMARSSPPAAPAGEPSSRHRPAVHVLALEQPIQAHQRVLAAAPGRTR
ncbi:hypothetical protein GQ55_5G286900 [Panicum hallii var. hallii]|uniref:Uncharacterized protein n=1 Tax=Panicum hallii var. hallii TaxID=1504633 RepID=A0A2T7DL70_9POAL|nr:hypothetical protein GQ55_5G286900 [Panicum hallii var. hallii]